ncbi:MAG: CHAP domain-containing protein [Clostridia bacterium]|nr:CHAP domain-containing protein [Clostridia bacterium]
MNLKKILSGLLASLLLASAATVAISALEPHGTGIKMRNWLTNDPNYQFSEAYKTSVWYQNFTVLELSENHRNNVLRIAVSQLGYHEGDSAADFDGMNFNGSSNYIEYARLLVPNYNDNHYEWCACFVNWCLNQAHIDYASSEIGCWKWVGELKSMKMWQDSAAYKGTYIPKPADFIFFNWDGKNTGSGHIGYVLYTTDTHVITIEGNADNNVTVRSYALNDPCVIGYGTPPYEEGTEPTLDYSYAEGMPRGTYVVNSMSANLRKTPDSGRICKVPVGSTITLHEVEGDYARVSYGENTGYLPKAYLYLLVEAVGEDTLTYDANGGEGAPDAQTVTIGEIGTVTDTIPVLEGDTFLGWSLTPYNLKVDFKAGDSISLAGDTTLYAVWEKHSAELAEKAAAEGLVPEYERPDVIQNSGALLLGSLTDTSIFTECGDTEVKLAEDETEGKALAFVSTAKSSDPYVVLPYGDLCKSLRLAPVSGDTVAYVILRVKDVSMNNVAVELYFNGQSSKATALLTVSDEWQYVVFNLADRGFEGDLDTLRIDWQKAASEAGNTMLLSDIFFASSEAVKDAILDGKYVYPVQELLEPETEPPTEVPTDPVTEPQTEVGTSNGSSDDTHVTEGNTSEETQPAKTGCFAVVGGSAWLGLAILVCLPVVLKKKED